MNLRQNKVPYKVPMPNNMGVVRYILAFSVLFSHFNGMVGETVFWPVSSYTAVGGFFALSGFLIYGSYLRQQNIRKYVAGRMRRLLPAYYFIVLSFAIALGFTSSLGVCRYFLDPGFWEYLACNITFLNFLHPDLPGVFENLSFRSVNGSLWTMKIEWCLYLSVPIVAWIIRKLKTKPTSVFVLIYVLACSYRILFDYLYGTTGKEIYHILGRQFFGQMSYFYTGVLIYFFFDTFKYYKYPLLLLSVAFVVFGDYIPYYRLTLEPMVISILVLWFSMIGRWGTWEGRYDNISYIIYLCHAPFINIAKSYDIAGTYGLWGALAFVVGATLALSILVSRLIERSFAIRKRADSKN